MADANKLIQKIQNREAVVGIIGLGYVGLPLVRAFTAKGFRVVGFDIDGKKVDKLKKGESYIEHLDFARLQQQCKDGHFDPTTDFGRIGEPDILLIAVPTPLNETREPDLGPVRATCEQIATGLRKDQLVVLESTTYPGTSRDVMKPILERSGLVTGQDYFLAYSPEREDPGNPKFETETIPKVVGGYDEDSLAVAKAIYESIIGQVVPVTSMESAELTKILENTFRAVNIALVNELKLLCLRMGIDVWEVIDAAATKPFGFMPFYPGPGLGGHCIPIDPFYLTWKAREYDFQTRFIELAGEINSMMPYSVIDNVMYALNERGKALKGAKVLVLGVAYKADVDDVRESPALKIIELLQDRGANVSFSDPHVSYVGHGRHYQLNMKGVPLSAGVLEESDAALILTNHKAFDYELVARHSKLVLDTRNAMKNVRQRDNIVKL